MFTMKKTLGIVIAIFNYENLSNLKAVLNSIDQQNIDNITVVSDYSKSKSKKIEKICKDSTNTKYLFNKSHSNEGNLSLAKNYGAKFLDTKYIYFTDADIIFHDNKYFEKILKINKSQSKPVLARPRMHRIYEDKMEFKKDFIVNKNKIDYTSLSNGSVFKYDSYSKSFKKLETTKTKINGNEYTCSRKRLEKLKSLKDSNELIWKATFHAGALFCEKKLFDKVGGFSQIYSRWGCEDDDILHKLKSINEVTILNKKYPDLKVLHIDHELPYKKTLEENKRKKKKRKNSFIDNLLGRNKIKKAIAKDRKNYKNLKLN